MPDSEGREALRERFDIIVFAAQFAARNPAGPGTSKQAAVKDLMEAVDEYVREREQTMKEALIVADSMMTLLWHRHRSHIPEGLEEDFAVAMRQVTGASR